MENTRNLFGGGSLFDGEKHLTESGVREYSRREEWSHALTHGIGALFGVGGLCLLICKSLQSGTSGIVSALIFGISIILLYTASFLYHTSSAVFGENTQSRVRDFFMKCDHSIIYILILGTYAPACISGLGGALGYLVLFAVGALCLCGVVLNVIDVEKYKKISLSLYVITGWTIALVSVPYFRAVGARGFSLLVLGGVFYTVGIIFYKLKRIPYMHLVWHLFVIAGSLMHFFMVYFYCI